jgi:hypothetical protein
LEEVIAQLDEFSSEETPYAADAAPDARGAVGSDEAAIDLPYSLEVSPAREAIAVWRNWRGRAGRRHRTTRSSGDVVRS